MQLRKLLCLFAACSAASVLVPAKCLAQPANDSCGAAEAIAITSGGSGTVAGDNTLATDDTGLPACTLSTSAASGTKGVWYAFMGTGNRIAFDICGQSTDLTFRVFCNGCATPVCAASDDDGCDGTNALAPRLAFCSTAGTPYLLLVSRFGTATAGAAFTLNWSDGGAACAAGTFPLCTGSAAPNDDCSGAIPVTIGSTIAGTNIDATAEATVPPSCNSIAVANAVWYSFVGDGTSVTVSSCSTVTGSNNKINIYTGVCGSLVCALGSSAGNATAVPACGNRSDSAAATAVCTVLGQTYYIAVSNDVNGAGLFDLTLTSGTCVPPPPNDACTGAITMTPGTNVTGNTALAANESPTPPTCTGFSTFNLGVWYTFTAPNSNRFIVSTCNAGTTFNTRVYVYTGNCAALACVGANAVASPACGVRADAATVALCAASGATYYILVTNDTTGTGQFKLSLTDTGSDCGNDICTGATPITVGTPVVGSTAAASNEAPVPPTCNGLSTFNLGVWHTFTEGATARRLNVTTCDSNTNFNTRVYVYSGSCEALNCINANAVASPACGVRADAASVTFCSVPGVTYYFLVTNDTTLTGNYGLSLTDTGIGCNPPANDQCAGATNIPSVPFTDTPTIDTATNDIDVSCNAAANTETRFGVWYTYTTGSDPGNLVVSETGGNDVVIAAFSGPDCTNLTQVACSDPEASANILLPLPNTTYRILVGFASATTVPTTTLTYTLNFSAFNAATGACCTNGSCAIGTASACTGTFLGANVTCDPAPQYQDNPGGPVAIADYPGAGLIRTITVPASDTTMITDLQIRVNFVHTFGSDIGIKLLTPNNTPIDLFFRAGAAACALGATGDGSGLSGSYTFTDSAATSLGAAMLASTAAIPAGSYKASTCPLADVSINSVVMGQPLAGTWTLEIADHDEAVTGTFSGFSLIANGGNSPCPQPSTGACCRGSTCAVDTAANCIGFANAYSGNGTVCNVFGVNNLMPCCLADYNHVGGITVQDIFDFLAGYFTTDAKADVNGGGITVQDIFDFLAVYFSGGC